MPALDDLIGAPAVQPVWTAEFASASQTILALAASAVTPAEIEAEPGGDFSRFPNAGYAVIAYGGRQEIVRYGGKSPDGAKLLAVVRGRFHTRLRDWPGGATVREWGLDRPFSSVPLEGAVPVLLAPSVSRQGLDDERLTAAVASFSFRLADRDGKIAELIALTPLRDRAVTLRLGLPGLDWPEAFRTVARGRVRSAVSEDGGASWRFQCRGIFGELKDRPLFPSRRSRLTADTDAVQTALPVGDTGRFLGTAGVPVRYARIGDEIVAYTGLSTPAGAGDFTGCTRGMFATVPAVHTADDEVIQLYEFGGHPLDVLLQLLTTTEAGGNGPYDTPAHRGGAALGLDAALIDIAAVEDVRDGLVPGLLVRFLVEEEADDAKRWIEDELLKASGVILAETEDARLTVKFLGPPFPERAPAVLGPAFLVAQGERLDLGLESLRNVIEVRYSRDPVTEDYLERLLFVDADSVSRHGAAPKLLLELQGVHGNRSPLGDSGGDRLAERIALRLGTSLANPRTRLKADAPFQMTGLSPGDVVELRHGRLPPGTPEEDRPLVEAVRFPGPRLAEISARSVAPGTGRVTFELREAPYALLRYAFIHEDGAPDYADADPPGRRFAYLAGDGGTPADPNASPLPFAGGGPPYALYPA